MFDQLQLILLFKAEKVIHTTRKRVATRRLRNAGLNSKECRSFYVFHNKILYFLYRTWYTLFSLFWIMIGGGVIRSRRRILTRTECRIRFGREFNPDNEGTRKLAAAIYQDTFLQYNQFWKFLKHFFFILIKYFFMFSCLT